MPLDTVVCVDTSGSMAGRGMRELKVACKKMLDDVRCTAMDTSLRENVALVEFGNKVRVACPLTNDYDRFERAVDSLAPGGRTPMKEGLQLALGEIIVHGGVLRLAVQGSAVYLSPRVILMTDGVPTDENGETRAAREGVLELARQFGSDWRTVGLPHKVPISCFCCGDSMPDLLQSIAERTDGSFAAGDVSDLSSFFRRQVLLTRFVIECAHDLERLRSRLALQAFLEALGEAVEDEEMEGLSRLLLALLVVSADDAGGGGGAEQLLATAALGASLGATLAAGAGGGGLGGPAPVSGRQLPPCGSRVRRGRDWKWGDQDSGGCGTIVGHQPPGIVAVEWDNGRGNVYRYGAENAFDLRVVDEARVLRPDEQVKPGVLVTRSRGWRGGDRDGGAGCTGVVFNIDDGGRKVWVRWKATGTQQSYTLSDGFREGEVQLYRPTARPVPRPRQQPQTHYNQLSDPPAPNRHPRADQPGFADGSTTVTRITADDFLGLGAGKYSWQWQADDKSWHLFPDRQAAALEAAYPRQVHVSLTTEGVAWTVDLKEMEERSSRGQVRPVRRAALSNRDRELAEAIERSLVIQ